MRKDSPPSPAVGALRCGECERKLVVYFLRGMASIGQTEKAALAQMMTDTHQKVAEEMVGIMTDTYRRAADFVESGIHEHGGHLIPRCEKCEEDPDGNHVR